MARIQLILLPLLAVAVSVKALDTEHRSVQTCNGDCAQVQYGEVKTGVAIEVIIPLPPIFKNGILEYNID
jgi:hypothetical protein